MSENLIPEEPYRTIARNLQRLEARISAACARVGRNRSEVTLVAVSKTRSIAEIRAAYACGLRHFGENLVEEAETKIPELRRALADDPAVWHLIGHVQSRKARRAAELADLIHSVDSVRLATRLDRFAEELSRRLPILVQINVSGEATKYGWAAWDAETSEASLREIESLAKLEHLEVRGLMTMAPLVDDAELVRPVFRALRELRDLYRQRLDFSAWRDLSMGMTNDFEVAIEEGATLVRIGRALFDPNT